jgi:hypothetical protein
MKPDPLPFRLLGLSLVFAWGCAGSPPPEPAPFADEPASPAAPEPEAVPEPSAATDNSEQPVAEPVATAQPQAETDSPEKPPSVAETPPAPPAEPTPPPEIEGQLVARTKNVVRVKLSGELRPEKDQSLKLLRFFSGKAGDKSPIGALAGIFGAKVSVSGWVNIAEVRVTKVDGAVVTLEIEKEDSKVVVNGKRVNHFTPGAKLKLAARE